MTTTDTHPERPALTDTTMAAEIELLAADPPLQIDGVLVAERIYVQNPYLIPALGSMAGFLIAVAGTAWSAFRGYERVDLAFGLALGLLFVMAVCTRRFNAWDRA